MVAKTALNESMLYRPMNFITYSAKEPQVTEPVLRDLDRGWMNNSSNRRSTILRGENHVLYELP